MYRPTPTARKADRSGVGAVREPEAAGPWGHGSVHASAIAGSEEPWRSRSSTPRRSIGLVVSRFLGEAQATAQLQHPNIVPVYDMGDARRPGLVHHAGGRGRDAGRPSTVATTCRTSMRPPAGPWTLRSLVAALAQICDAMDYAHRRGVVHQDIKPANIMLGAHGEVRVSTGDSRRSSTDRTASGRPPPRPQTPSDGTRHMSGLREPGGCYRRNARLHVARAGEWRRRRRPRTDIYALGALLYELLAGRAPYTGHDGLAVLEVVRAGPPSRQPPVQPPGLRGRSRAAARPHHGGRPFPPVLVAACERAMARDRNDRSPRPAHSERCSGGRRLPAASGCTRRLPDAGRAGAGSRAPPDERPDPPRRAMLDSVPGGHRRKTRSRDGRRTKPTGSTVARGPAHRGGAVAAWLARTCPRAAEAHAALAERCRAEHAALERARHDPSRIEARLRSTSLALTGRSRPHRPRSYLKGDGALTCARIHRAPRSNSSATSHTDGDWCGNAWNSTPPCRRCRCRWAATCRTTPHTSRSTTPWPSDAANTGMASARRRPPARPPAPEGSLSPTSATSTRAGPSSAVERQRTGSVTAASGSMDSSSGNTPSPTRIHLPRCPLPRVARRGPRPCTEGTGRTRPFDRRPHPRLRRHPVHASSR